MKKMRMTIMMLLPLTLLIGICVAQDVQAGVRVKATINTPNLRVQFGNASLNHYRAFGREVLPVRMHKHFKIAKRDRTIARRLARFTGMPAQVLVNARARGYTWFEIGRWLYLPRPVVRAAMNQKTWKRFLRREQFFAMRDFDGPPRHRVIHLDSGGYEDLDEFGGDFDDEPIGRYKGRFDDD